MVSTLGDLFVVVPCVRAVFVRIVLRGRALVGVRVRRWPHRLGLASGLVSPRCVSPCCSRVDVLSLLRGVLFGYPVDYVACFVCVNQRGASLFVVR